MNKTALFVGTGLALVLLAVGVYIFVIAPRQDCSTSGWKHSLGVDVETSVGDLRAVKGKVGITDEQIRDFDEFLKDFSVKYDTACMDFRGKRISKTEYDCRRANMDRVLDKLRFFVTKVQAAKSVQDPSVQRDAILKALDDLETTSQAGYSSGCASSLAVDPHKVKFANAEVVQVVAVSNYGANPILVTVQGLPAALHAEPKTSPIASGQTINFAIYRLRMPISKQAPLLLHLIDNFQDDITVEIEVEGDNVTAYSGLAEQTLKAAQDKKRPPTVEDALQTATDVLRSTAKQIRDPEPAKYLIAAGILSQIGSPVAAGKAVEIARSTDPQLRTDPSFLLLRGVISSQGGDFSNALAEFSEAKKEAAPRQASYHDLSDIFTGAVKLKTQEEKNPAAVWTPSVRKSLRDNPDYVGYVRDALGVKDVDKLLSPTTGAS